MALSCLIQHGAFFFALMAHGFHAPVRVGQLMIGWESKLGLRRNDAMSLRTGLV